MSDETKSTTSTMLKATASYRRAVTVEATGDSRTTVSVAAHHTVSASRVDGEIRVRLVPTTTPTSSDDTF